MSLHICCVVLTVLLYMRVSLPTKQDLKPGTSTIYSYHKFLSQSLDGQQSCVFPTDVCGKWVHSHCGPTDYCLFWFTIRMTLKGDAVDFKSCSCPDCVTSPSITASHWPCRFFRSSKSWCLHPDAEQQQDLEVCVCVCVCWCHPCRDVWFFFAIVVGTLSFAGPDWERGCFYTRISLDLELE